MNVSNVAVAVNTVFSANGADKTNEPFVPSAGITTVPKTLPLLSVTVTVEFAVPAIFITVSLLSTGNKDGVSNGIAVNESAANAFAKDVVSSLGKNTAEVKIVGAVISSGTVTG